MADDRDYEAERVDKLVRPWLATTRAEADDIVLEHFMVIGIFNRRDENGRLEELTRMTCSTSSRYAQEGIMRQALREHDRYMREGDDPEDG